MSMVNSKSNQREKIFSFDCEVVFFRKNKLTSNVSKAFLFQSRLSKLICSSISVSNGKFFVIAAIDQWIEQVFRSDTYHVYTKMSSPSTSFSIGQTIQPMECNQLDVSWKENRWWWKRTLVLEWKTFMQRSSSHNHTNS